MSQNGQRHYHIGGVDRRSLCDLYSAAQFAPTKEGEQVSVCGACILVVEHLFAQVKGFIVRFGQPHPEPFEALESLRATRWDEYLNIDDLQEELERINYEYPSVDVTHEGRQEDDNDESP